jgi:hypothetical protein
MDEKNSDSELRGVAHRPFLIFCVLVGLFF